MKGVQWFDGLQKWAVFRTWIAEKLQKNSMQISEIIFKEDDLQF